MTSFQAGPPPNELTLVALPDDVLSAYNVLGGMPQEWGGYTFVGDAEERRIDYARAGEDEPVISFRAYRPDDGSILTSDQVLARRLFLTPFGAGDIDPRGAVIGRIEGVVWALSPTPGGGQTLMWSLDNGKMLWVLNSGPGIALSEPLAMIQEVATAVLRG